MWTRTVSDPFEDGFNLDSYKGGCDSSWPLPSSAPSNGNRGRRHSATSDSGDTGIGTSCSDSVEDQSSSSTGPSSFPRQGGGGPPSIPTALVMPSPSSSSSLAGRQLGGGPSWGGSCHQLLPLATPTLTPSPLDMRDPRPVRRWSSLTRLSAGGADPKPSSRAAPAYRGGSGLSLDRGLLYGYPPSSQDPSPLPSDTPLPHHGSLDRGLLYGYRHPAACSDPLRHQGATTTSLLLRSPGADPRYRYESTACTAGGGAGSSTGADSSLSSALSSPLKPSSLDLSYAALPSTGLEMNYGPLPPSGLELNYGALPESRGLVPGGGGAPSGGGGSRGARNNMGGSSTLSSSPIQPAVRTQMWLSEQMEQYRPPPQGELSAAAAWATATHEHRDRLRQEAELNQMLTGTSLPVNTLVKIKEGLLRQRELEIDRQKQQILQLHARIRENELRAQQVLHSQRGRCDDTYLLKTKDPSLFDGPTCASATGSSVGEASVAPASEHSGGATTCCQKNGELARRVAAAELEVLQLNDFLKHNAQKYSDDVKKLEEKMKTRDRYISSLKKKCQRESEQNAEKQQRIETLERYLAELPPVEDTHTHTEQLNTAQQRCKVLEDKVLSLERSLTEAQGQVTLKDQLIETQSSREKELLATVHSLQQKVEQCLHDGVRLPVMDMKQLEVENSHLVDTQIQHSKLIDSQKKQIDRLSQELTATERRLQLQKDVTQQLQRHLAERQTQRQTDHVGVRAPPGCEAGSLLKEMSVCLMELQALCSILSQRAHGQTPNLGLLLGIQSMSVSGEENDNTVVTAMDSDSGLRDKLMEVGALRRDIDALRRSIQDRYAQDMGENCVTQ